MPEIYDMVQYREFWEGGGRVSFRYDVRLNRRTADGEMELVTYFAEHGNMHDAVAQRANSDHPDTFVFMLKAVNLQVLR